jgi:hypothetical protein
MTKEEAITFLVIFALMVLVFLLPSEPPEGPDSL